MRAALLTVLLVSASMPAWSTTVYKWVDEAGVVHFSDTPHPGAQKIEVGNPQTYAAPATLPATATQSAQSRIPVTVTSCAIDSPANDQVFTDTAQVSGHVSISPAPGPGDTVTLTLDGAPVSGAAGGFTMSVERGTHTLALTVTGGNGDLHCQSSATFHVRQQSVVPPTAPTAPGVLNPNRPH